jgi:Protein of unknown function (DUF3606)
MTQAPGKLTASAPFPPDYVVMNANFEMKVPTRRGDINLSEPAARRFWAENFGVSEKEIIEAVKQVGGSHEEVKKFLAK